MKYVGEELTISMPEKPTIRCDAPAAIGFVDCVEKVGRMKHIDLRECWVQELRSNVTIKQKCDATANKADQMTKTLPLNAFKAEEDELMPMLDGVLTIEWPIGVEPADITSVALSKQSRGDVYMRGRASEWTPWIEKPQLDSSWGHTAKSG